MTNLNRGHAIVLGGSMAGLLAARVLSGHFRQVTIVERDPLPDEALPRRGVPQGRHTHGLLAGGGQVLERLFPDLSRELIAAGAVPGDLAANVQWFLEGAPLRRFTSGLQGLCMTRPFLEAAVRRKVRALPNVTLRDNLSVDELLAEGGRVEGVRAAGETLPADLTVDTSGRGSRTPQWLEKLGYPKPPEETVKVDLGYMTRYFRRHPSQMGGDCAAIIPPTAQGKRGGVIIAQEGERWSATLIGHFGHYPPEDLAGFIEFARTLPSQCLYSVVRDSEPLSEGMSYRFPASLRRRYETLDRFPAGYLVFGDALSSFNPIYGQGMTVAALEAIELQAALSAGEPDLARAFFGRAAKVVDNPWSIAVGNDLRMPETIGPRTRAVNFVNWYMSKLHRAAHSDAAVANAFHLVGNLLAPPPSVMHPRIALRVLWGNLKPSPLRLTPEEARAAAGAD